MTIFDNFLRPRLNMEITTINQAANALHKACIEDGIPESMWSNAIENAVRRGEIKVIDDFYFHKGETTRDDGSVFSWKNEREYHGGVRVFTEEIKRWLTQNNQRYPSYLFNDEKQAAKEPLSVNNEVKKQRTRKTNLNRAVEAAVKSFTKKPSFDELWQYFQEDKDTTRFIEDYTDTHLIWRDTKGKLHDTKKSTIANHLSRL